MKTLSFKTNINCSGCVAKITPVLDHKEGVGSWKVDTENPQKILTVETTVLSGEDIMETVRNAGFTIQHL